MATPPPPPTTTTTDESTSSSASSWSLTIRLSSGNRLTIDTFPKGGLTIDTFPKGGNTTIAETKSIIENNTKTTDFGLESSRQRLVYKTRILDDDSRSLKDYGVVHQSTLMLVMSSASMFGDVGTIIKYIWNRSRGMKTTETTVLEK